MKKSFDGFSKGLQDGQKKNVDALNNLGKSITGVQTEADKLGKTKIEMQAELQGRDIVIAGLREMKTSGEDLDGKTITITTRLSGNEEVLRGLTEVEGVEMRLDGDTAVITVRGDNIEQTVAGLEAVEFALSNVDGQTATARVDVDGVPEAIAGTSAVDEGLDNIDDRHVEAKVDVDTSTASANVKNLITQLDNAGTSIGTFSRNIGLARGGIAILGAVILELASAVVPLLGGLTVLGGLITAAAAGFGILAGAAINLGVGLSKVHDANQKVQDTTDKLQAAQTKLNTALESGNEEEVSKARKELATATNNLEKAEAAAAATTEKWGTDIDTLYTKFAHLTSGLSEAFAPATKALAAVGVQVLDLAEQALPALEVAAGKVGAAFQRAMEDIIASIQSAEMKEAWQSILDAAAPVVENLTKAVGDLGLALLKVFSVATPAAVTLSEKIADIAQAFLDWSTSAEGIDQINAAVQAAVPLFTELWEQLKNVGAALLQFSQEHGEEAVSTIKLIGEVTTQLITGIGDLLTAFNNLHTGLESAGASLNQLSPSLSELVTGTDQSSESMGKLRTAVDNLPASLDSLALSIRQSLITALSSADQQLATDSQHIRDTLASAWDGAVQDAESKFGPIGPALSSTLDGADQQLSQDAEAIRTSLASTWDAAVRDVDSKFGPVNTRLSEVLQQADTQLATDSEHIRTTLAAAWDGAATDAESKFGPVRDNLIRILQEADTQLATDSTAIRTTLATAWDGAATDAESKFGPVRDNLIRILQEADTQLATDSEHIRTTLATAWDNASADAESKFKPVKDWIVKYLTEADDEGTEQADELNQHVGNAWDLLGISTDEAWNGMKTVVLAAIDAIVARVSLGLIPAVQEAIQYMGELKGAAMQLESFLGIKSPGTAMGSGVGGQGTGPGGRTGMARGGIEDNTESQGPDGGITDGASPRVVYGEQKRNVKEAYIVEDREDNVPYLAEAASWHGYQLVKMQAGGVTPGGTSPTTPTSGASTGDQCFVPALIPVSSPTASELQPYADSAATQAGFLPGGIPAADWTGSDHVNVPAEQVSGDPFGGQGGTIPTPWPALALMPSGYTGTSWATTNPSGPSFAMAGGGTLPGGASGGGGSAPTDSAVPISYQIVPLSAWDTFLNQQWCADPAVDWPVLYPPSDWDPSQVYSPAAMKRGGILRGGIRYFQGGGISQAQIEAGIAAGSSVLGSPYSYGSAGEDGGFDCAGIWNYIEAAVLYGAPQTGKRWGTGGIPYPAGNTPGGLNFGETLTGGGGFDDTHMAGDIGGTGFESTIPNGVFNGGPATAFPDQYTAGGPAEVAGMLPSDVGTAPPSTTPAPTMDQTVADWWTALAPPVPDATTGATTAQPTNQTINKTLSQNTGDDQSSSGGGGGSTGGGTTTPGGGTPTTPGGGTGGPTRRQRRSDKRKRRNERGKKRRAKHRQGLGGIIGMAQGGTLVDGVQNWMAALPAVTLPYLQNLGQQTLGSTGSVGGSPLGTTLEDWIIAALEGLGMDPTPEAIATLSSLAGKESGGDPNATGAMGEYGLMQLMPDTWSAFGVGGDPYDPVANLMASINYQLQKYGSLVDFSPYKDGGYTLKPHLGLVGEGGGEAMLPLENRSVMASMRAGLGTEGFTEAFENLSARIDHVAERVDYQTRVAPELTGRYVKTGYDSAVTRDHETRRAFSRGRDFDAKRRWFAGV